MTRAAAGFEDGVELTRAGDGIEAMGATPMESMAAARAVAGRAAIGEHAIVVRINREGAVTYRRLRARS